jgi:hypothetical protein
VTVAAKDGGAQVTVSLADDAVAVVAPAPLAAPAALGAADSSNTAPESPPAGSNGSTQRVLGWTAVGVGVVGVAFGSVFGFDAKSKNDEATNQDGCSGSTCKGPNSVQGAAASSDASSAANASTIAFVVGGVALAAGVVIVLTAPSGHAVHVAPAVGQSFGGLAAYGFW